MKDLKWQKATGRTPEGKQIKCLTSSEGHVFMPSYDKLSPKVRYRIANSPFNMCAACISIETGKRTNRLKPTDADYFRCIEIIEWALRGDKS